ncbi:uncharacterized protein P884DRAFT_272326 [Thermothelomyces heterothallicus CBS 202.75]|uniref:uncharacterized protein n=1 Tax=Thermothelomyces heterothallicus CBS 202.75 TaxID=1149848 RepID=UPI003742BFE7
MKLKIVACLAMVASAIAQGVTEKIAPEGDAPSGCKPNFDGPFQITVVPLTDKAKRDLALEVCGSLLATSDSRRVGRSQVPPEKPIRRVHINAHSDKRQQSRMIANQGTLPQRKQTRATCSGEGTLVLRLSDGVLTDAQERTGYIASNYQFQFDGPPQAGAIYTAGFTACANGSLALGDSAVFWQCASGTFYNLYDRWWAEQCSPVDIVVLPCGGDAGAGSQEGQNTVGGQVVTTTVVVPLSDGQPQVITTTTIIPICQIDDGQIQGHTTPCASAPTTAPGSPSRPPVSQISDGQIQVTPGPPVVSQISDGQIQVSARPPSESTAFVTATATGSASASAPGSGTEPAPTSSQSAPTGAPPAATGAASAVLAPGGAAAYRTVAAAAMAWLGVAWMSWV